MALFEPVTLKWNGVDYTIPANRSLRAIAKVEEVITLQQLGNQEAIPFAKIAMAYGALLRFAGAPATDDEIYDAIFTGDNTPAAATAALLSLMLPKRIRDKLEARSNQEARQEGQEPGNEPAVTPKASSNRRTRP